MRTALALSVFTVMLGNPSAHYGASGSTIGRTAADTASGCEIEAETVISTPQTVCDPFRVTHAVKAACRPRPIHVVYVKPTMVTEGAGWVKDTALRILDMLVATGEVRAGAIEFGGGSQDKVIPMTSELDKIRRSLRAIAEGAYGDVPEEATERAVEMIEGERNRAARC